MAGHRDASKKLRADRLELLRCRTAARLGFATVAEWQEATTLEERNQMLAVALLDGWGEEWQEVASVVHNVGMLLVSALAKGNVDKDTLKAPEDMRRFRHLETTSKPTPTTADWGAFAKTLCPWIGGDRA